MEKTFFLDMQQRAERYFQDRLLLLKLQSTEKVATISPGIILALVLAFIGFFIVLIASALAGYYLTILTGSFFKGFGIVLGIFVLLFVVMILIYRRFLKQYLTDLVVKSIFSN